METIKYEEALQNLEDKLVKVYQKYELETLEMSRKQITEAREKIELSLDDKQTLKEHFRDIVQQLDATGDQSKPSLFYGGGDLDGSMGEQVRHLQDDFRNITATDVGNFITRGHDSVIVQDLYKSVFGNDITDPQVRQSMLNFRNEQWIPASANYAKATEGQALFAVGENAKMSDIMYGVEYKNIEEVANVKEINGVTFDDTYRARPDEIKLNQMKVDIKAKKLIDKENFLHVDDALVKDTFNKDNPLTQELGDFQKDLFEKTQIAKAENIPYDEMFSKTITEQNEIVENFYNKSDMSQEKVLSQIDEYKNVAKVGKYGIVGAVALSMLPDQADASALHLNAHLDKDKFESLSNSEKIGAEIGVGFNAINAIQAGEEFKSGASKSASTLLDSNAYKEGFKEISQDAMKPILTKDVASMGVKESAKFAGKSLLKKLPIVGLVAGVGFGISRAMDGDWEGAAMEIASGAASIIPGPGTTASIGIDLALLERDTGILSKGTNRLLGREGIEEERLVQSEDNHTTIPIKQDINFSNDLDQEALEQRVDPQTHQTLHLNQVQDRQSETIAKIDTTEKSKEVLADLYPHLIPHLGMSNRQESIETQKEEPNPTQDNCSNRNTNTSSDTFENNNYYVEDDFNNMPKNHRPTNLPNNVPQQPLEENSFDSSAKANEIVAKMVEENGWDNDYGNSDDMGRDID